MLASACRRSAPALLALLALAGCKKKGSEPDIAEAFRDSVCRCTDRACVQAVLDTFAKVSMGGTATSQTAMDQAAICIENVNKLDVAAGSATGSGPMPAMPAQREADALLSAARNWQTTTHPGMSIWEVTISYVEASGMLDPEHGMMTVQFGASATPVDDPQRKTGAPVKAASTKPTECPTLTLAKAGWTSFDNTCADVASYIPKCTVAEVWKKAITMGAPKDALATVRFSNVSRQLWSFTITDEPRNVNIAHEFVDDCERTLEKSP
jgi:hypothetical protein